MRNIRLWLVLGVIAAMLLVTPMYAGGGTVELSVNPDAPHGVTTNNNAPDTAVPLVLDDGAIDNSVGVNGGGVAYQFIWLNRFTPAVTDYPFQLTQIWVLWPTGQVAVGDAIDLVVYEDADGNPANGATWLATFPVTVTVVSNTQWAQYTLPTPVALNGPSGDVLIGAIDRFVVSGVTPANYPAAIDTTTSAVRSWVGWWNTDPPDPAVLPPDATFATLDALGLPGNLMLRGYGVKAPTAVSISALTSQSSAAPLFLVVLGLPIALVAVVIARRRLTR